MANTNNFYDVVYLHDQGFMERELWLEGKKKAFADHLRDLDFNVEDHEKRHVTITDGKPLKNFTWEK